MLSWAWALSLSAQTGLVTHNDFTVQTLVQDVFASGACDNIQAIQRIGALGGVGYFENGADILGLDRGIILSTGPTSNAHGPNDATDTTGDFLDSTGDQDLSLLATGPVFDASGIEFDFTPLDSTVSFRYVFASEEYCEFVGSTYNDVFGFFISGPGVSGGFTGGATNVALIPGSGDFVAINSVNHASNSAYYVHNELPEDVNDCDLGAIETPHLANIEYDGFTTVLTAVLTLAPCETYHIRLVVGDVGDEFFDSAVFLEAGSFNLGGEVHLTAHGGNAGPTSVYEGCDDGYFRFYRSNDSPIEHPLTINYNYGIFSTATPGTDFTGLPGQVTIPAGEPHIDITLETMADDIDEDFELVQVILDIPCACYAQDSAAIRIVDPPPLTLEVEGAYLCPDQTGSITALAEGGIPPYQFDWSNGQTGPSIPISGVGGDTYQVTLSDACEHVEIESVTTESAEAPTAFIDTSAQLCQGDTVWLPLELSGQPPFAIELDWDGGATITHLVNEQGTLPFFAGGQYSLTGVSDLACSGTASGDVSISETILEVTDNVWPVSCFNGSDGAISISVTGGVAPYDFEWSGIMGNQAELHQLPAGSYGVQVTDADGCQKEAFFEVTEPDALFGPQVDCEALALGTPVYTASGGTPPYLYRTNASNWTASDWWSSLASGQTYELSVQDANGCELAVDWLAPAPYPQGMTNLADPLKLVLGEQFTLEPQLLIPEDLVWQYEWRPAEHLSCTACPKPTIAAIESFTLEWVTTDVFGCQDIQSINVLVEDRLDVFLPTAFSPNADGINDLWNVYGNPQQIMTIHQVVIFDRWGGVVYQRNDLPLNSDRHGWDGTKNGAALDPGVYVYQIEFGLVNGKTRIVGGDILLIR